MFEMNQKVSSCLGILYVDKLTVYQLGSLERADVDMDWEADCVVSSELQGERSGDTQVRGSIDATVVSCVNINSCGGTHGLVDGNVQLERADVDMDREANCMVGGELQGEQSFNGGGNGDTQVGGGSIDTTMVSQ